MTEAINTIRERWLITITVMLVAVAEVLDTTIVNVALPDMTSALNANAEEITWVLTSYIVAAAIFMPLTGLLVKRLGRKRLLLMNIVGFFLASVLCGIATSLTEIVFFRTLQGVFGAALVPLSQFILRDTFPQEEQGKAMAIWGMGIMAGPVLGPTLGGYITESLNWRWVFYINIPVCIIAFMMTLRYITETPTHRQPIDWLGIVLMSSAIGSLQMLLDRGNVDDWFNSSFILLLAVTCVITLVWFITRGMQRADNIIDLRIFRDRNFTTSTLMITIFATCLFGIIALQPLMLETLFGYPTLTAGLIMAPRGLASAVGMAMVARFINRYDPRIFITIGLILCAVGTYQVSRFNLSVDVAHNIYSSILQGFGMGLFFVPLSVLAFTNLHGQASAEAAGLFSFGRSLGGSIGISICSTLISRSSQAHWNQLGGHLNPYNPALQTLLLQHGYPQQQALLFKHLGKELGRQSGMLAFAQTHGILAITFALLLIMLYTIPKPSLGGSAELAH